MDEKLDPDEDKLGKMRKIYVAKAKNMKSMARFNPYLRTISLFTSNSKALKTVLLI